jgi:protein ImuA
MISTKKANVIETLQMDILRLQGFNLARNETLDVGLGPILNAFPNRSFPLGALHEFLSERIEHSASTSGFVSGLLSSLMGNTGTVVWITSSRTLFPPALKSYGLQPDRFIFIDLQKEKDVIWAMDEALKCNALSAVVGEVRELDFTTSRRLQLAVEQSHVNGFILRNQYRNLNPTACVSRWKITPLPSERIDDLPGIGFPTWRVELLRVRNGKSGAWNLQWVDGNFVPVHQSPLITQTQKQKAG